MNKLSQFASVTRGRKGWSRHENRMGRMLRDEQHSAAGADSGAGANNTGENNGTAASGATPPDNGGQTFDPATFWNQPASDSRTPPLPGSAGQTESLAGTPQSQTGETQGNANFATEFATRLRGQTFGDVFTPDAISGLETGDASTLNQAISAQMQTAMTQAVRFSAELMQEHGRQLAAQVQQLVQQGIAAALGNRDNVSTLESEFPELYADPAARPIVEQVFNQSLTHAGGDRKKAAAMAKDMIRLIAGRTADAGFVDRTAVPNGGMTTEAQSLVDELLGRN